MIITLELLQEKEACEDGINYFKSLDKQEWEAMELVKKCIEDKAGYANWLFRKFQLTGVCETFYGNGNLRMRCYYIDGKRESECQYFYPNGNLSDECSYKKDKIDGECKSFDKNGNVYLSCYYKAGKLHGKCKSFYENGNLQSIEYYKKGKRVGEVENYQNGKRVKS
jgi:antitoxin component YwqK of YwqJK toxin-antitoxin module